MGRELRIEDLKFESLPAPKLGGMRVDFPGSGMRVTHVPTGLSAESSDQRGQYANRQAAIEKLRRLLEDSANG